MGSRSFKICCGLILGLVLMSGTPFPGAMIGFLFGVAVAFFLAPPSFILLGLIQRAGYPATIEMVFKGLGAAYVLLVGLLVIRASRAWRGGATDEARMVTVRAMLFVALPLAGYLSSQALMKAWP